MKNYIIVAIERLFIVFFKIISLFLMMQYLSVAEMGIVAILTIFFGLSTLVLDSGFSGAFLRKEKIEKADYDFLYTNSLLLALLLYISSVLISYFLGNIKNIDNLYIYVSIMMLSIFLKNKIIVFNLFLLSKRDFKEIAKINNISQIFSFFILLFLLLNNFKIYSFVFQILLESFFVYFLYYRKNYFNCVFNLKYSNYVNEMKIAYSTLISSLVRNSYEYFLSFFILNNYGIKSLGMYSQANKVNSLFTTSFMGIVDKVTYVTYTKIDGKELFKKFNFIFFISVCISSLILLISVFFIKMVVRDYLSSEWTPILEFIPYLMICALFTVADLNIRTLIKAKLKSFFILKNEFLKKGIALLILLFLGFLNVEFNSLIKSIVLISLISFLISVLSVIRYLKYNTGFLLNIIFLFIIAIVGWSLL